ncbi:hypothetical protein C8R46DRAFT_1050705 [Mycena filopes]|nr:hypothetical protein C8R46DRAFT_1050705 [Mycena filopes]
MGRNGQKRVRERVPKAERQNLRLWAEGSRETVLRPHLDAYSQALDQGWNTERKYLKKVYKEFHARVDWRLADHEEPVLKDFDPKEPIPSVELDPAEEVAMQARKWVLNAFRNHRTGAVVDPTKDPFAVLLAKLSGVTVPPKARQAFQQFMHESYAEVVAPIVAAQWEAKREAEPGNLDLKKEPKAGFRAQVARELFGRLDKAEQKAFGERAKAEAVSRKEVYQTAMCNPPSETPADRPILHSIQQHTGLHAVLVFGGPMPKYSGELRTLHVAYGHNRTAASQSWPQWDKARFGTQVIDFMTEYLRTAFTPQDCASSSLTPLASLAGAKYTIGTGHEREFFSARMKLAEKGAVALTRRVGGRASRAALQNVIGAVARVAYLGEASMAPCCELDEDDICFWKVK